MDKKHNSDKKKKTKIKDGVDELILELENKLQDFLDADIPLRKIWKGSDQAMIQAERILEVYGKFPQ